MGDSVDFYERFIGKPYRFGGFDDSYDCLTLMIAIVNEKYELGIKRPEGLNEDWAEHDRSRYWLETLLKTVLIRK